MILVEHDEEVVDGAIGVQEVDAATEGHDFIITQLAVRVGVLQRVDWINMLYKGALKGPSQVVRI